MDKANLNKDAVTQRILETTQETERLKQELQNLIAAGISGSKNYNIPSSKPNLPLDSANKVQIIKSYDSKHSQHIKNLPEGPAKSTDPFESKNEAQALSPKKPKSYDVDKAREYIKRQRDKRKEVSKTKKTESKVTVEMRKEKLQELQQKATELVRKNIKAKRQRSKSRDRADIPPANESIIVGFNCAGKTKNHLAEPDTHQIRKIKPTRDPNMLYPPEPTAGLRRKGSAKDLLHSLEPGLTLKKESSTVAKSTRGFESSTVAKSPKGFNDLNVASITRNKHSKSLQNLLHPPEPYFGPQKQTPEFKSNKSSENISKQMAIKEDSLIVQSNITSKAASGIDIQSESKRFPIKSESHKVIDKCLKEPSPIKKSSSDKAQSVKKDHADVYFKTISSKFNKDGLLKEFPKKINILSNVTLRRSQKSPSNVKDHKEEIVTPEWLKDSVGQGDPYNFINTVKRQLKYVVNEKKPNYVDVGVQGNLEDNIIEPNTGDVSKKSDLKSFISHKCLNLDPHLIQHIEINRKKSTLSLQDGPTVTNNYLCSDCDSDTSKNIPSISSESGTSLRRNAEIVKQSYSISDLKPLENAPPNLDTKKVDDIKLRKTSKLDSEINSQQTSRITTFLRVPLQDDVEKVKKKLFSDSDCYSSDFIPTDHGKSRDSLISFNCAKVSPNRVPDQYKSGSENTNSSFLKISSNYSSETGAIPKEQSQTKMPPESDMKNRPLNSGSEGDSQKRDSRSAQFRSLYSDLHPSTTDPDLKLTDYNLAHLNIAEVGGSEMGTVISEKNSWQSDGFTEVLRPKDLLTDSNHSHTALPHDENIQIVSNLKSSEKSASELRKSRSEQIVSNKRSASVFSKSESDIYENKENLTGISLREPKLSLNVREKKRRGLDASAKQALMKNISIRSRDQTSSGMNNTNEIHLKFEAEIHLLNDFNQSLKHFSEIEKAFQSLRSKNDSEMVTTKVLQNRDTQTSIITKTSTKTVSKQSSNRSSSQISTINYSRGSGLDLEIHSDQDDYSELSKRSEINSEIKLADKDTSLEVSKQSKHKTDTVLELTQGSESELSNVLNSGNLEDSELGNVSQRTSSVLQWSQIDDVTVGTRSFRDENLVIKNFAGMSLRMFDQLIKDEDARIENWKKIVKIREQALLDRTRGELVYLEMQKKQLIETGKMPEASLIKKKQRGILLKHQQEKHEMQRLKQMQKEASAKRKTLLKKEKNLIKNQLLSDNILSKLKPSSHREGNERRLSGPLKVIQATGSIHSETSLSRGVGGTDQEIKNTSRTCSLIVSAASEISEVEPLELTLARSKNMSAQAISSMKKRLLMREQALAKRRKTVEELLQWHKKLLEEEKAIEDLESKVEKIISKIPSESNEEPSKQSLDLSKSISERTSSDLNIPPMSQVVLERRLPSKDKVPGKSKGTSLEANKNIPKENHSEESNNLVSSANYSTDFDVESIREVLPQNSDDPSNVSSISQLIKNFSKIEDNILNLSLVQKRQSLESDEAEVISAKSARTDSSAVEEIVQDEERSEASSNSNQVASEVEVKVREESLSEIIPTEKPDVEGSDKSVILIEQPDEHTVESSEDHKLVSLDEIEEIKEGSPRKENEEFTEVREKISESLRIESSENENSPKTSFELHEPSDVWVSGEPKDLNVPDKSNTISSRDIILSEVVAEASTSVASELTEDKSAERRKVSDQITLELKGEEESIREISTAEPIQGKEEEKLQVITKNEPNLEEVSVKIPEDIEKTCIDVDILAISVKTSSIHEESKPSTSHQKSAESNHLLSTEDRVFPFSRKPSGHNTPEIRDHILLEEPVIPTNRADVSSSQQNEEIEELVTSPVNIPSTSHQTEDQATSSQILSLTKDDVSNHVEEQEAQSSAGTSSIGENDLQSPSIVEEERQSFENKTDEEKVASLSIRPSGSPNGSVSEDRARSSVSITRPSSLSIPEPSISEERSLTTSKGLSKFSGDVAASSVVSRTTLLSEPTSVSIANGERLSGASVMEQRSQESDNKAAEKYIKDISTISESSKIDSADEKPHFSLIQDKSLTTEKKSKLSSEDGDEASGSGATDASLIQEKAEPLVVEDNSISTASSASIHEKSISSEKPSKSSTSNEKSNAVSEKLESSSQKLSITPEKSPRISLDVKKRVQEILTEASLVSRGDKSPRMQDLCVMTYDLISPTQSPESGSPLEERTRSFSLGSEAEELLRKQLAIEQEIKILTEQQQKEQAPQFYIREIPNKPPPPYTPPSKAKSPKTPSIIPSSKEEIEQITEYSAKIIHKAYLSNNLDNISISDNTLNLIAKNINKGCYKYVFDLCKEVAIDHYSQFIKEEGPSWLQLEKKVALAPVKPLDVKGLKKLMHKKLLELFGFEKQDKRKENAIMKWSRKKRDHVDEVLVQEMQARENSWTNFDRDELIVKDRITNEIMEMLLMDTTQVLKKTVHKKAASQ